MRIERIVGDAVKCNIKYSEDVESDRVLYLSALKIADRIMKMPYNEDYMEKETEDKKNLLKILEGFWKGEGDFPRDERGFRTYSGGIKASNEYKKFLSFKDIVDIDLELLGLEAQFHTANPDYYEEMALLERYFDRYLTDISEEDKKDMKSIYNKGWVSLIEGVNVKGIYKEIDEMKAEEKFERSIGIFGKADIVSRDTLYYVATEKYSPYWAQLYLNILNLIFDKPLLAVIEIGIDEGHFHVLDVPLLTKEETRRLINQAKTEKTAYILAEQNSKEYQDENTIKMEILHQYDYSFIDDISLAYKEGSRELIEGWASVEDSTYAFDVHKYIDQIMGNLKGCDENTPVVILKKLIDPKPCCLKIAVVKKKHTCCRNLFILLWGLSQLPFPTTKYPRTLEKVIEHMRPIVDSDFICTQDIDKTSEVTNRFLSSVLKQLCA